MLPTPSLGRGQIWRGKDSKQSCAQQATAVTIPGRRKAGVL
ncbi:hypothetical protein NC652_024686 [Populus alba x Populus x berolinensis]|nr:hypothetical protein NC652_024686 [Populus alba x Populus x berolinensis]